MKSPLHIAIVSSTPYAPPWSEGVRNLMRALAHYLTGIKGARVSVLSPYRKGENGYQEHPLTIIPVSLIPDWHGSHSILTFVSHFISWIKTAVRLRRLNPRPDLIFVFASLSSATGFRTRLLKLAANRPIFLYITGLSNPIRGFQVGLSADTIFVGNAFLKNWLPGSEILPPFLPIKTASAQASPGDKKRNEVFNFGFLGSFENGRGVEVLLEAMAILKNQTDLPVELTLAWNGTGEDNYGNIVQMIDGLGLRSSTRLKGEVDVYKFYREADIVVIPRVAERYMAFPVRIIEAISMQTPLIVSRICGMEELIYDCGLSVEPGNPMDLAAAMLKVIKDDALLQQFKLNCLTAIKHYETRTILDGLFRRIEERTSDGRKRSS